MSIKAIVLVTLLARQTLVQNPGKIAVEYELPSLLVQATLNLTVVIFEATARAFTNRLSADVRYLEVSAKCNIRVTEIFRTLLELSGFPRCKAGGGALEDPSDSQSGNDPSSEPHALRRVNTARARAVSKEVPQGKSETEKNGHPPATDKQQTLPCLGIPTNLIDLKRNRSLRMRSPRGEKEREHLERRSSDETCKLSRSASLIKRTKHLSLRMRRHGDKVGDDDVVDESDCKIQ